MWIFSTEPKGKSYEELLDLAEKLCNEFILIRRDRYNLSKNAENLLKELSKFQVEEKEQQSWPGTRTTQYVTVYYFVLNYVTKDILKKYSKSLYSWMEPSLLEDLCFFKDNRKPWIINIAHEKFSYIDNCNDDEIKKLKCIKEIQLEKI